MGGAEYAALERETIRLPHAADPAEDRVVRPALSVLFRLAVGPGADYYGPRFLAFERAGRGTTAWHWPALFLPAVWAFYRKLWVTGLLFALLPLAGALVLAWVAPWLDDSTVLWSACAVLLVFLLPGVTGASLANALLYRRVRARIARAEAAAPNASQAASTIGGSDPVSPVAAALCGSLAAALWVAAVGPLLTTAYGEHAVRVKVAKALAGLAPIQAQIEDSWRTMRQWPQQGMAVALPMRAGAVLFDEISVDPDTGRVKLSVGRLRSRNSPAWRSCSRPLSIGAIGCNGSACRSVSPIASCPRPAGSRRAVPRCRTLAPTPGAWQGTCETRPCRCGAAASGGSARHRATRAHGGRMKSILDPSFRYTSSANTDLRKTFARLRREMRRQTRVEAEAAAKVSPLFERAASRGGQGRQR